MDVQHEDPPEDYQDAGPSAGAGNQEERMQTMSPFERLMVNRLDSFAENQRNLHDLCVRNFQRIDNRFDNMDARFMTLDEQIEAVQNQIFDHQFVDDDEWRKKPVDVSEQPIVFSGYIWFFKILFLSVVATLILM